MIEIKLMDWHSRQRLVALFHNNYFMHLMPGKTDEEALKNAIKELKRLETECNEQLKTITNTRKNNSKHR